MYNPQKYFIDLDLDKERNNNFFLNQLETTPQNLCPFAAHILYPYFLSFKKGSWFRWSKSKKSVIAQCPNPKGGVVFEITKKENDLIVAKIIKLKGECLAKHKIGDIFELNAGSIKLFEKEICELNQIDNLSLSVVNHSKLCRYYKKPGTLIKKNNFVPINFCLPVYYKIYPWALSLLYDGQRFESLGKEKTINLDCQNCKNSVNMQIKTKRNLLTPVLNLLEKFFRWLGCPRDVLDKSIDIEVSNKNGMCLKNLQSGQLFKFNLRKKRELCPAVFYTLFPFWVMLSNKIFPYWTKNKNEIDIQCPDAFAEIIFKIKKLKDE